MYYTYMLCDKLGAPLYVGQGRYLRVYRWMIPSGKRWFEKKYGAEPFLTFVITAKTKEQSLQLEKELIAKYKPKCNIALWGTYNGVKKSLEARTVMRAKLKGRRFGMGVRGRIKTPEHLRKIGEAHRGKIISVEQRRKLSEAWYRNKARQCPMP